MNCTCGASGKSGDTPAVVDGKIIVHLKSQHDEQGFIKLDTRLRFAAGDVVRVQIGIDSVDAA